MKAKILSVASVAVIALNAMRGEAQPQYSGPGVSNPAAGYYASPPPPAPIPLGNNGASLPSAPAPVGSNGTFPPTPAPQPNGLMPLATSKGAAPSYSNDPITPNPAFQDEPYSRGFWSAGGGVYFMTPYFTANPAIYTVNSAGTTFGLTDFHQHMSVAPLAWLGYTWDNGWGIRARWFQFDSNAQAGLITDTTVASVGIPTLGTFTPSPGSVVSASSSLNMTVIDLEATSLWAVGRWTILASAGVRYAHFSQNYQFSVADPIFGLTSASSGNNFTGAGPTMSVELRRKMFDVDNSSAPSAGFFLYGSARGSLLFGSSHQFAVTPFVIEDPNFFAGQATVISVAELEVGAEWACMVGRARLSVQAALTGQAWLGGNNSTAGIAAFEFGTGMTNNFGFLGGVVRAGISF